MDKYLILNNIKKYYKFNTDAEFARFLGITPQNLKQWYTRNTFDAHILATKCSEVSADWLLTGDGKMLKENIPKERNLTLQGENISLQSFVDIIKLQQESIKMFNETTLAQQKTIQLQISKNETQQKSLELIQESLKMILDLQSKITFQQTQIPTSVRKEENVECADAG